MPLTPICYNLYKRILWFTQSKDFVKSKNTPCTTFPSSNMFIGCVKKEKIAVVDVE